MPAPDVESIVDDFVKAARAAFGDDLGAAVLYGSAAEGKLRKTSDVNLLLVLSKFERERADHLREPLRLARLSVRLTVMLLLDSEIEGALEAFAVKFDDILHRRRVLFGVDPFEGRSVSRSASIVRLNQVLLNLSLRLREAYVARGLREDALALVVADAAGPLRASAAALLELEGGAAGSPKEALERVAPSLGVARWRETLDALSQAREEGHLPEGVAGAVLFGLVDLALAMRAQVLRLAP